MTDVFHTCGCGTAFMDASVYYVKVQSRKKHRDGCCDLVVQVISVRQPNDDGFVQDAKLAACQRLVARLYPSTCLATQEGSDLSSQACQGILKSLITTNCHCLLRCEVPLHPTQPYTPVQHVSLVSIAPSTPVLRVLLDSVDTLPKSCLVALLTPNPLNFKTNVRSAAHSLVPRPPEDSKTLESILTQCTPKQIVTRLLGSSHRQRLPPVAPQDLQQLERFEAELQPVRPKNLPPPQVPKDAPIKLRNYTAPSAHGSTTRLEYIYDKKLPQIYSLLQVLIEYLPESPVEILDVGGGRGDLARNILFYLQRLGRTRDRVTIVDSNSQAADDFDDEPAITFVHSSLAQFTPRIRYFATLGLHTCGSLTDEILERAPHFTKSLLLVVPCCYSKIVEHSVFPPDICRLCEYNQRPHISQRAMQVINALRLGRQAALWDLTTLTFSREYSAKCLVLLGRPKKDVYCVAIEANKTTDVTRIIE